MLTPFALIIGATVTVQLIMVALAELLLTRRFRRQTTLKKASLKIGGCSKSLNVTRTKDRPDYEEQDFLDLLDCTKIAEGFGASTRLAKARYDAQSAANSDARETDIYFFHNFGSSASTMMFYDAVDQGPVFKAKLKLSAIIPIGISSLFARSAILEIRFLVGLLVVTAIYYVDVIKDVLIAVQFKNKVFGPSMTNLSYSDAAQNATYPFVLFMVMLSSLAATEIANLCTVLFHRSTRRWRISTRVAAALLVPAMPAILTYLEHRNKMEVLQAVRKSSPANQTLEEPLRSQIKKLRTDERRLQAVRSQLRANENFLEHFVQFSLFALVLCAEQSPTRSVQPIGKILLDENVAYVILGTGLSFLSLLRGQLAYVSTMKNGHLSVVGKAILAVYFSVSIAGRLLAMSAFAAPLLGLFGLLKMAHMGLLPVSADLIYDLRQMELGRSPFLEAHWRPLRLQHVGQMYAGPAVTALHLALPAAILTLHVAAGLALRRWVTGSGWDRWHVLYTFVCPPVFIDWEEIYRRAADSLTIAESWRRSMTALVGYVALHAVENAALCAPLLLLRLVASERAAALRESHFPLLSDELETTMMTDWMLGSGLVAFIIVLPAAQIILALIYLRHGHAWSRVISREVKIFPWDQLTNA